MDVLDLSVRLSDRRFHYFYNQVLSFDFKPMVCGSFYAYLTANMGSYQTLINGGSYECEGVTYSFRGLTVALAHWWYGRYVIEGNLHDTGFDVVIKQSEYSESANTGQRQRVAAQHTHMAKQAWAECVSYLEAVEDAEWAKCCGKRVNNSFKSSVI